VNSHRNSGADAQSRDYREPLGETAQTVRAVSSELAESERAFKRITWNGGTVSEDIPLFSIAVTYGGLVFISGVAANVAGDTKASTHQVLDTIKERLQAVGSSVGNILKCNVYLTSLDNYEEMNEVFKGGFGPEPPVRTTIVAAGLPGNALIEIDVIACL
jgi:2-iminobutanoate/2-iminopropanoate deaminase